MAAATSGECFGLYKALYAYESQGDDEVTMQEDQLVLLLDKSDDDWSKVRLKQPSQQDLEGPEGLVPAAYIEKATPLGTVKAQYDYDASAPGELSIVDGETLQVFERDEDWILVESQLKGGKCKVGYVPANYVEDTDGTEESSSAPAVPSASAIVIPDSPPRPSFKTPEELTHDRAASLDKTKNDPVETWPLSMIDKKGKKKKGTLGVGNGTLFFASESDKTPVQQWKASDVNDVSLDHKAKQIDVELSSGESLKFICKDSADAVYKKIESSRSLANGLSASHMDNERMSIDSRVITSPYAPRAVDAVSAPKSVHFAPSTSEIPPRPDTPSDEGPEVNGNADPDADAEGETAVALYDFTGDASDELSIKEGETLVVLDRTNDDWWKCRNHTGQEGVVPAQYVDLEIAEQPQETPTQAPHAVAAASAAAAAAARVKPPSPESSDHEDSEDERVREREREEKERKEQERREREERRKQQEREAQLAAEREAKEAERVRIAEERKRAQEKKDRAAKQARLQKQEKEAQRNKSNSKRSMDSSDAASIDDDDPAAQARRLALQKQIEKDMERQGQGRATNPLTPRHGPPPTGKTRVWHDRTGQFRVEAEFKGYENGKIRLHKLNGVTIEVPSSKMSEEDMRYIARITGKDTGAHVSKSSSQDPDNVPLATLARQQASAPATPSAPRSSTSKPPGSSSNVDWFKFFLEAGCDMDDCTRYAQAFERDKIDETILPDMKSETLRALGFREGDIIRVVKAIEKKTWKSAIDANNPRIRAQIEADERYAQEVQQAILMGKTPPPPPGPIPSRAPVNPAPHIFSEKNGVLKNNTRRGRPTPSNSRTMALSVDEEALASASSQLGSPLTPTTANRTPSPNLIDAGATSTTAAAASTSNAKAGFEDNAWEIRPSSAKPTSPSVAITPPIASASAPPAPAPPAPPAPVQPAAPAATSAQLAPPASQSAGTSPTVTSPAIEALTKELELLEKIEKLRQPRPPSAPVTGLQAPAPPPAPSPSLTSVPPVPSLATLQAQPTGFLAGGALNPNGVRGPFAPVPGNEGVLLKPLIPTNTGMIGFVPTRPASSPIPPRPMLAQATGFQPQPTGIQAINPFQPQPTGFQPQPTGFQPQATAFQPQMTGFQPQPSLFAQPTGIAGGLSPLMTQQSGIPLGMRTTPSPIPPVPAIPSQFSPAAPSLFNQPSFNQTPITTQPLSSLNLGPPSASPPPANHTPANVFASMKSGTFGGSEHAAPAAPNYDAMRANPGMSPMAPQPTGWIPGMQQPNFQYR